MNLVLNRLEEAREEDLIYARRAVGCDMSGGRQQDSRASETDYAFTYVDYQSASCLSSSRPLSPLWFPGRRFFPAVSPLLCRSGGTGTKRLTACDRPFTRGRSDSKTKYLQVLTPSNWLMANRPIKVGGGGRGGATERWVRGFYLGKF